VCQTVWGCSKCSGGEQVVKNILNWVNFILIRPLLSCTYLHWMLICGIPNTGYRKFGVCWRPCTSVVW
jgi:hypothetical protein